MVRISLREICYEKKNSSSRTEFSAENCLDPQGENLGQESPDFHLGDPTCACNECQSLTVEGNPDTGQECV